ncbi:ubiquitin-like domain-containing protein [Salinibacillus aidingensis]|uniref:Ubiquitin-like domain-containing protein n=1 Tax=Salinibacillus aidingensis TaxID=237684 RepID=A0ABP3LQT7_9BACI
MRNLLSRASSFVKNYRKMVMMVASTIVLVASLGILIYETTKKDVVLVINGEEQSVRTHADTVEELLSSRDIKVDNYDEIHPETSETIEQGMKVAYTKAKQVTVKVDDQSNQYYTTAQTIGEFLKEKKITFNSHDQLSVEKSDEVKEGLEIKVDKAFQITLNDGGEKKKVWTTADTVEEFLKQEEIKLDDNDKLKQKKDQLIAKSDSIDITRVEVVEDVVKENVEYGTTTRSDDSMTKGQRKVIQEGQEGLVTKRYEVTLENGEEVDRELIDKQVEKESQDQIVAMGTKPAGPTPTVSRGDNGEVVEEYMMTATVYTEKCNGCSGITSTGIDLRNAPNKKVVAVDPNVIPLGSKVWVEGYGYAVAGDTGGAIKGSRIDLFKHSSKYNGGYGHRKVKVKVYK